MESKNKEIVPAVNIFYYNRAKGLLLLILLIRHYLFAQRQFRYRNSYLVECNTSEDCPVEHDQRICNRGVCYGNDLVNLIVLQKT